MTLLVHDSIFLEHETYDHPECPARLQAIDEELNRRGLIKKCRRLQPKPISDATPLSARLLASLATPALSASARRSPWAASSSPNGRRPAVTNSFRRRG